MNRFKKEEKRKREEARRGLSQEEIAELDAKEELQEEIIRETEELHTQIFPEEYDYMYDSIADANDRAKGKCPMNKSYINEINIRREFLGVSPVDSMGIPISNDSWQRCLAFIKRKKRNNKLDKDK